MTIDPSKPQLSTTGCLLRIGVAMFAVVCVSGLVAAGYFFVDQQKHHKTLVAEIQAIRDAGEPLDGAALNEFYRVPEGETDITAEWVAALGPFSIDKPLGRSAKNLERLLTLHKRGEEPPHRPEAWLQQAEAEQLLAPYREALVRLVAVSRQTGSVRYPIDFTADPSTELSHLTGSRCAGVALELQTLLHYHRGEMTQAADCVLAFIQMSETLKREPLFISQADRYLYLGVAEKLTLFLAADAKFPEEELARIQKVLGRVEFESIRLPVFLAARAIDYQCFTQPYALTASEQAAGKEFAVAKGTVVFQSRPGDVAMYLHWSARAIEAARLPFPEATTAARQRDQDLRVAVRAEEAQPKFLQNCVSLHHLSFAAGFVEEFGRATTKVKGLQLACAIERFRRREQGWPKSPEGLVPNYLPSIPLDPYTGQPLAITLSESGYYITGENGFVGSFERVSPPAEPPSFGPGFPSPQAPLTRPPPGPP